MGDWRWKDSGGGSGSDRIQQRSFKRRQGGLWTSGTSRTGPYFGARPVFLVDVLNELCKVLEIDGSKLWDLPGE